MKLTLWTTPARISQTVLGIVLLGSLVSAPLGGQRDWAQAQARPGATQALTMDADTQEANSKTGVITARGNVRINYPARRIQATAAQAQYFSREGRIVLTGNVYVIQSGGNSIRGEVVTYLVNEGRFVALPRPSQQVRSVYMINDTDTNAATP